MARFPGQVHQHADFAIGRRVAHSTSRMETAGELADQPLDFATRRVVRDRAMPNRISNSRKLLDGVRADGFIKSRIRAVHRLQNGNGPIGRPRVSGLASAMRQTPR